MAQKYNLVESDYQSYLIKLSSNLQVQYKTNVIHEDLSWQCDPVDRSSNMWFSFIQGATL